MLYPLKFQSIYKEKIWGGKKIQSYFGKNSITSDKLGESWELSGVEDNYSIIINGSLKDRSLKDILIEYKHLLVGKKNYERFGNDFPILIKFIDASDVLSVQVHPDDKLAGQRHNSFGKTEMWYVIDAEPESKMVLGFNKPITKQEYLHLIEKSDKTDFVNILNNQNIHAGDVFFIPPGRVHAIGKGIFLAEIQQTSDITYRIYDWDRLDDKGNPRELQTDLAVDSIDFTYHKKYNTEYTLLHNETTKLVKCNFFTTNLIEFDKIIRKDYSAFDSFVIYMCLEGDFLIETQLDKADVKKGETILIPAEIKKINLHPKENSKILEIFIESV